MSESAMIRDRYLDLLENVLTGYLMEDPPLETQTPIDAAMTSAARHTSYRSNIRETGLDWPSRAFTMIGLKRLRNFRMLIERALRDNVPGDIIETGVWRGGACMMARAVLLAHEVKDRKVILADSFEGLPPPDESAYPADRDANFHTYKDLAISLETVRENFRKLDLLDDQVVFLKGWFKDTMPRIPSEKLAVMRLDGDMYQSTIDPLNHLYDKLSPGGWVIVDDYFLEPCREAVHDFLRGRAISPDIRKADALGAYFQKP